VYVWRTPDPCERLGLGPSSRDAAAPVTVAALHAWRRTTARLPPDAAKTRRIDADGQKAITLPPATCDATEAARTRQGTTETGPPGEVCRTSRRTTQTCFPQKDGAAGVRPGPATGPIPRDCASCAVIRADLHRPRLRKFRSHPPRRHPPPLRNFPSQPSGPAPAAPATPPKKNRWPPRRAG